MYKFDIRDNKPERFLGFSYQGLYPIFDFTISTSAYDFDLEKFKYPQEFIDDFVVQGTQVSGVYNRQQLYTETQNAVKDDLKVLANPKYRKYEYHLVFEISFSTRILEGPANYICYVDAHTGELLMRKNTVMYEAPPTGTATVSGEVYPTNPYNPTITQNFRYLKAIDQIIFLVLSISAFTWISLEITGLYIDKLI